MSTVEFHRVLRAPAARVYQAFVNPDAWAKWLPPHGFVATVHEHEPRVGGRWRMSFTHLGSGHRHSFGDRKSTRLNSSHSQQSRMPSSA